MDYHTGIYRIIVWDLWAFEHLLLKQLKRTKNPETMVTSISSSMIYSKLKDMLSTKRATQKDGTVNSIQ